MERSRRQKIVLAILLTIVTAIIAITVPIGILYPHTGNMAATILLTLLFHYMFWRGVLETFTDITE